MDNTQGPFTVYTFEASLTRANEEEGRGGGGGGERALGRVVLDEHF